MPAENPKLLHILSNTLSTKDGQVFTLYKPQSPEATERPTEPIVEVEPAETTLSFPFNPYTIPERGIPSRAHERGRLVELRVASVLTRRPDVTEVIVFKPHCEEDINQIDLNVKFDPDNSPAGLESVNVQVKSGTRGLNHFYKVIRNRQVAENDTKTTWEYLAERKLIPINGGNRRKSRQNIIALVSDEAILETFDTWLQRISVYRREPSNLAAD